MASGHFNFQSIPHLTQPHPSGILLESQYNLVSIIFSNLHPLEGEISTCPTKLKRSHASSEQSSVLM